MAQAQQGDDRPGAAAAASRRTTSRDWPLLLAFALCVFGSRSAWVAYAGSPLPIHDQRLESELVASTAAHGFPLRDLAMPHNEHRILTTRVLALGLYGASGYWNVLGSLLASAAVYALAYATLLGALLSLVSGWERPGLVALLLAEAGLPLSPLNLLSGFQVQFGFVLLFAALSLSLVGSGRSGRRWGLVATTACLLAGFLSMAPGTIAALACLAVVSLRMLARRRVTRGGASLAFHLFALGVLGIAFTPRLPHLGAAAAADPLAAFVRCLAFPLGAVPAWAAVAQLPLLGLTALLLLRGDARDRAWTVVGLGLWSLAIAMAITVSRGEAASPTEQQHELAALPLVWSYLAIGRLRRAVAPGGPPSRALEAATAAWLALALCFLGLHSARASWPKLRAAHDARAGAIERFRAVLERGPDAGRAEDETRSLVRYPSLDPLRFARDPHLAALLPPELTGREPPPMPARVTAVLLHAWPAAIAGGGVFLGAALRRRRGETVA